MDFDVCILSFQWEGIEDATSSSEKGIEYSVTLRERVSNNKHVVACDLAMVKEKVIEFHRTCSFFLSRKVLTLTFPNSFQEAFLGQLKIGCRFSPYITWHWI